jgi:hypothetical protein
MIVTNLWTYEATDFMVKTLDKPNYFLKDLKCFNTFGVNQVINQLTLSLKTNIKVTYFDFSKRSGWLLSIGVITRLFKLVEKRERKIDKNKLLFLTYILKNSLVTTRIRQFSLNKYKIATHVLLRKSMVFKKVEVMGINVNVPQKTKFGARVKRIKRRLKKRMFRYEISRS